MLASEVAGIIDDTRVVPVIVIDDPGRAPDTASALEAGGIFCGEITLRTPEALAAIERIARENPGFIVGAGTILSTYHVDSAIEAGAHFLVSPGFDEVVVSRALERGIPIIPGVATATEIQRALKMGLTRVKFFPAGVLGGVGALRALSGPFPEVRFLPSGGVSVANAREFLQDPSVFAISGSWMATREMIDQGAFAEIQLAARVIADLAVQERPR